MTTRYHARRPARYRPPRLRPGLWIDLGGSRPIVRIAAPDALELDRLRQLAELVEHVLAAAFRRGVAGAA